MFPLDLLVPLLATVVPMPATRIDLAPSPRFYVQAAYDTRRQRTWLYGGRDSSGIRGDLWHWDGHRWVDHGEQLPAARACHALAYDSRRDRLVLFGGGGTDDDLYDADLWEWDGRSWARQTPAAGPSPRGCMAMVFDERRGVVVLYGGSRNGGQPDSGETWEWDGRTWRLAAGEGPAGRSFHAMAYDSKRHRTLHFGGRDGTSELSAWDGRSWMTLATDGPPRRDHHTVAYDEARDRFIVFGGGGYDSSGGSSGLSREHWEFDGSRWHRIHAPDAPFRFGMAAFVYDRTRKVVLLHGGSGGAPGRNRGTWTWDGSEWREVAGP